MAKPRRQYRSELRARNAQATRAAILAAGRRTFACRGYQSTTIEAIAAEANLAVPTIYAAFGSKAAILTTLVSTAAGDPKIREAAANARQETDPIRRVRGAAHVMRLALESEAELLGVLLQAGSGNQELDAAWRQMHDNRHSTLSSVFAPLLPAGARRRAFVDTAWVLGSPEVYRLLVAIRGWTPAAYEAWLAGSLVKSLADHKSHSLEVGR